jgi:primary-amine oxidase
MFEPILDLTAHPLGFIVVLDLNEGKVIEVQDLPNEENTSVPKRESNYDYKLKKGGKSFLRQDDKPITVDSPEGPSYKITGNQVQWQKWKLRFGYYKPNL